MNQNIAKIIKFLAFRQQHNNLCTVGRERLRWWRRNGKKFRSVKAALNTWDIEAIQAWFSYANISQQSAPHRLSNKEADHYYAVEDFSGSFGHTNALPPPFRARASKLERDMEAWMERTGKASLLILTERQLLGDAADNPELW